MVGVRVIGVMVVVGVRVMTFLNLIIFKIQESDRRAAEERRLEVSRTIAADSYKSPNSLSYGSTIPRENHDDDKKQSVSPYLVVFSLSFSSLMISFLNGS